MKWTTVLVMVGCAAEGPAPTETVNTIDQAATVCGVGPTVKGIDVSYYQGTINWAAVKADGVQFAFIRVSDGTGFEDPKFGSYWSASRANGILHGAYQFFRPGQNVIAQADLLLTKMGPLKPDDLPPVLDVEAADGNSASQVAAKVKQWVDHVTAAIGRPPIIYTGYYFWRDSVGDPDMSTSPLWHAQYTSASCPQIADAWPSWSFWQYTSTGPISGISGGVDVDRWNGDRASLDAFVGPAGSCGDGTCNAGETSASCPEDCGPCGTIDAGGGAIDNSSACFEAGGPQAYMRHVTDAGETGELLWTHATESPTESNFGQWNLYFAAGGRYKVEVSTAAKYAHSKQAKYVIETSTAKTDVVLDQSAVDGWQALGEFDFAQGGHQSLHLGDNTGEPLANMVELAFDAVRFTPVDGGMGSGSGSGSGSGVGTTPGGGCAVGGNGAGLAIALLALVRRRRR